MKNHLPTIKTGPVNPRRRIFNNNFLLFCFITAACAYYYANYIPIVIDDAYIYFRVADNLLETGKPIFNRQDNSFIVTSPLWTFLLAGGQIAFFGFDMVIIAKILWMVMLAAASWLAYMTFFPYLKKWACFVGVPFYLSPEICTMSGNEVALLYAALFLTIWGYLHNKPVAAGIGLGAGYLARGECVLIFLPLLVHYLLTAPKKQASYKHICLYLLKICLPAFSIALLWHIYYFRIFGDFFPQTLPVKIFQGRSGQWILYHQHWWPHIKELLGGRIYLLIFVLIGILWQPYLFGLTAGYTLLHFLAYYFLKVPDYHWYYYDFYLFTLFFMFFGIGKLLDILTQALTSLFSRFFRDVGVAPSAPGSPHPKTKRTKRGPDLTRSKKRSTLSLSQRAGLLAWIISRLKEFHNPKNDPQTQWPLGLFILFIIWFFPLHYEAFWPGNFDASNAQTSSTREQRLRDQIERHHSYLKLCQRLGDDLQENDIILLPEIGIISYYLKNYEIRDVNGLASSDFPVSYINNYHYFVNRYLPRFIIFPQPKPANMLKLQYHENIYWYKLHFIADPNALSYPAVVYTIWP